MAQFADLSGAQQEEIQKFLNSLLRPAVGTGVRYVNGTVMPMLLDWINYGEVIVASLDSGAVIPNTSGLAGAQSLTKEQVQSLMTGFSNLITNYASGSVPATQAAACGAANMITT